MKRIVVVFFLLGFALSTLGAQDKVVAKADTAKRQVKNAGCQMDCCCKRECMKDKTEMKKDCPKMKKEETKK